MLTMNVLLVLLSLIPIIIFSLFLFFIRHFHHWKKRGIPYLKPTPLFGNAQGLVTLKKRIEETINDVYDVMPGPFFGFFLIDKPFLIIKDPTLVKRILVKDFNNFSDNAFGQRKGDLSYYMLPMLKGDEWRTYRKYVNAACSQSVIRKNYFNCIKEIGEELVAYLEKTVKNESIVDVRRLFKMYGAELITNIGMGVKANCFKNPKSMYLEAAKELLNFTSLSRCLAGISFFIYPSLIKLFGLTFLDPKIEGFYRKIFFNTLKEREELKNEEPRDFVDYLLKIKSNEELNDDNIDEKLFAHAMTLLVAGFESQTSTLMMLFYELANNKEIQDNLRKEISDVFGEIKPEDITLDMFLTDMKYLDIVIKESLRKHPPFAYVHRICKNDYTVEDHDIVIENGTTVVIPISALQKDPKYFPDPEKFLPERFSEENMKNLTPYTYMPFAEGPRDCPGKKLGLIVVKYAVARILQKFKVELKDESQKTMEFVTRAVTLIPKEEKSLFRFTKI